MYEPLYKKVKPLRIEEVVGQRHLLGEGKPLRTLIERGKVPSLIFYGPPGVGKTLVAELLSERIKAQFVKISAVNSGMSELKKIKEEAENWKRWKKETVLFVDEIHRFNKAQQEFLLPLIEDGTIILIGASTENPIFALTKALFSRVMVFEFKPLEAGEIKTIVERAARKLGIAVSEDALSYIAKKAAGDARKALNMLELAHMCAQGKEIDAQTVAEAAGERAPIKYGEDEHYNVISAFIKSIRGSDPDAALYWLAVMLSAGEDPLYITRRLMILAAEDIGLADPEALNIAVSAHHAVSHVGMPEAELILAFATLYLAASPKSNSAYLAVKKALSFVKEHPKVEVPHHLMDARSFGKDKSARYLYPHDYPGGFVRQNYMKHNVLFYIPKAIGREKEIAERLRRFWNERYTENENAEPKA